TAAGFRGDWYVTGDRATRDGDGYLWFTGRADDVINSAAYRIGPFEVESALLEHAGVAESAVVGKPDADRGLIVKAFVVLRPGTAGSEELVRELQEHCKRVTAPYKYPREIEFVDELPKTRSGKIRRGALNPDVTPATIRQTICARGWTKTVRPPTSYTSSLKLVQMRGYGFSGGPADYQEDHFISLELGGAPSDRKNLWPERRPRADHVDTIENDLNAKVCSGELSLSDAQ